jgi:hypothetical protein
MSIDQPSYLVGSGGGILRDPQARLFFEHYVAETACQLGTVSQAETPFITLVLPLALSDDLIMHSLLALSGAHLSHEKTWNAQIHVTTYLHYAIVVHDLQAALAEGNPTNLSRLLLATLMLCTFEVSWRLYYPSFALYVLISRINRPFRPSRAILMGQSFII